MPGKVEREAQLISICSEKELNKGGEKGRRLEGKEEVEGNAEANKETLQCLHGFG